MRLRPLPPPLLPLLLVDRELTPTLRMPRPGTLRDEASGEPSACAPARGDTATTTDPPALVGTADPMTSVMLSLRPPSPAPAAPPRALLTVCALVTAADRLRLLIKTAARITPPISTAAPTAPPMIAAP